MSEPLVCDNPICKVAEDGRCVEGLELKECSHFGQSRLVIVGEGAAEALPERTVIGLSNADRMTPSAANLIARRGDARVVAILGPFKAGKTSLVASLFDAFQEGPVGNVGYSRSSTLRALEIACHDARVASKRKTPHSRHTPLGEIKFFHLQVVDAGRPATDLLLGDRAGEDYSSLTDDVSAASGYLEVPRADSITVLVDAARLASNADRHNHLEEVRMMLRALRDGQVLPTHARLAIVLTKVDMALASDMKDRIFQDFERLAAGIKAEFKDRFTEVGLIKVAASPENTTVKRGEGIQKLLEFWLPSAQTCSVVEMSAAAPSRAFDQLQARPR